MKTISCDIDLPSIRYEIVTLDGLLNDDKQLLKHLSSISSCFVIITDDIVAPLYGHKLHQLILNAGYKAILLTFPSGEQSKTRMTKEKLENQMFENGFSRDICVIALGGGVVTDLAGYIAATYCRGVSLINIPTSLLGMVDAAIGGKTGINVPYGKNLLGSVYSPKVVLIDPSALQSLPLKELKNGIVEMIKHGIAIDASYFTFLESQVSKLLSFDMAILERAIYESCLIKNTIVKEDRNETGKRRLLNFGHTVGHAIEALTDYQIPHGEAVAIGIIAESHMAMLLGHLKPSSFERIHQILINYGLPLQFPGKLTSEAIINAMILDKKSRQGKPRFVIINDIGSSLTFENQFCASIDENIINDSLQWTCNKLCFV